MSGRWRSCPRCKKAEHACARIETRQHGTLLSLREVARVLDVHWTRPYAMIRDGDLSYVTDHAHASVRYVALADVEAYRAQRDAHLRRFNRTRASRTAIAAE